MRSEAVQRPQVPSAPKRQQIPARTPPRPRLSTPTGPAPPGPENVDRQLCLLPGAPSEAPPPGVGPFSPWKTWGRPAFQSRCFSNSPAFKRRDREAWSVSWEGWSRSPRVSGPCPLPSPGSEGLLPFEHPCAWCWVCNPPTPRGHEVQQPLVNPEAWRGPRPAGS